MKMKERRRKKKEKKNNKQGGSGVWSPQSGESRYALLNQLAKFVARRNNV
jgi:hypothetical protein